MPAIKPSPLRCAKRGRGWDFILFLKEIRKVRMNDKWYLAEITAKTENLLAKLNIPIP